MKDIGNEITHVRILFKNSERLTMPMKVSNVSERNRLINNFQ